MDAEDPERAMPAAGGWLEDLVARALEALDREGEAGLARLLAEQPQHRAQVLELVERLRSTGLLARAMRPKPRPPPS